jgi:hypothetical protein
MHATEGSLFAGGKPDGAFVLVGGSGCRGVPGPGVDDVVRVADSLR